MGSRRAITGWQVVWMVSAGVLLCALAADSGDTSQNDAAPVISLSKEQVSVQSASSSAADAKMIESFQIASDVLPQQERDAHKPQAPAWGQSQIPALALGACASILVDGVSHIQEAPKQADTNSTANVPSNPAPDLDKAKPPGAVVPQAAYLRASPLGGPVIVSNEANKTNAEKTKSAPIVVSSPMKVNPRDTWDDIFDGMVRKENARTQRLAYGAEESSAPPPVDTAPKLPAKTAPPLVRKFSDAPPLPPAPTLPRAIVVPSMETASLRKDGITRVPDAFDGGVVAIPDSPTPSAPPEFPGSAQPPQKKSTEVQVINLVSAQEPGIPVGPAPAVVPSLSPSCPTCGRSGGLPPRDFPSLGGCATCGRGSCVPGQMPCPPCESHTLLGGFFCDLYGCLCCPDPCFEPKWLPLQDSAFFVDAARPQSQMKVGWDWGRNLIDPDRSEYFWARADGKGKGPAPVAPFLGEGRVQYDDLLMYMETAVGGKFSTFISYPYLSMDPQYASHAAGFGDMSIGTKTNMFDCELLLVAFQMKTTIPTGIPSKGLGTGHVSLEPSLLFALKLASQTYLQGQLSEWIPIGGDPSYQGSIFHSHASLNQVLCRVTPDVPIVATFEVSQWTFQHGNYTDPIDGGFQKSSGGVYMSMGPGLRLFICNRIDFGGGVAFAVTEQHFAQTLLRMEFRFRY